MFEKTVKVAKYLQKLNLKEGSVVGLIAGNSENLAAVVFACLVTGFPLNSLAPTFSELEFVQMFTQTSPKIVFCDMKKVEVLRNALKRMKSDAKIVTLSGERVDGCECVADILNQDVSVKNFIPPKLNSSSIAVILCSSGSTGSPKAICKSHKQCITECVPQFPLNHEQQIVFLQLSAMYWYSGFYVLVTSTLYQFKRIITEQQITSQIIIDAINKYQVTNVFTAPYAIVDLLENKNLKPFKSVRHWIVGGARVTINLVEKLRKFVPNGIIATAYGCTECGFVAINNENTKYGSCGRPVSNVAIKVSSSQKIMNT
jgi:acyl-coenzyme A synthetase/AMP-(fatty) acid ligase